MYHLLVHFSGWKPDHGILTYDRVFENTDPKLVNAFKPSGRLDQSKIIRIPALLATETGGEGEQLVRVAYIDRVEEGKDINIYYHFDAEIPPIPNVRLQQMALELGIEGYELSRTHWAIKGVDLFRVLLMSQQAPKLSPKVFRLEEDSNTDDNLVSVMMPFASEYDKVYETLQGMSEKLRLRCLRADDIWQNEAVIQDVVSLICQSRIVICDCTGRNPNVFYETGIAHALGKDVILIAQNEHDIPFDLRHLRYVTYLDNDEGRKDLSDKLSQRIQTLKGQS
jgi:hypothetical protein